jgi:hypothetical protein
MSINFHLTTGIDADIDEQPFSEDGPQDPFERAAISGIADLLDLIQQNGIVVSVEIDGETRRFDVDLPGNSVIEYPISNEEN